MMPSLTDRKEAGRLLAKRLSGLSNHPNTLVVAIPRGGIEIGWVVSRALQLPLTIFLSRKLEFPGNPEYAIGGITETGYIWLHPDIPLITQGRRIPYQRYLDEEIARQRQEIRRQHTVYRHGTPLPALRDRTVILVDDGVATGATYLAALHSLYSLGASTIISAIPVAPQKTLTLIRPLVHQLEVLETPDPFVAVGAYYEHFPPVSDQEIMKCIPTASQTSMIQNHSIWKSSDRKEKLVG